MKVRTHDKRTLFDRAIKALTGQKHATAVAGLIQGKGAEDTHPDDPSKTPLVVAAAANEFGAKGAGASRNVVIPERAAFRMAFDANRSKYERIEEIEARKVLEGTQTPAGVLHQIAEEMAGDIKQMLKAGIPPPNAPSTIAKKGADHPLTDTGLTAARVTSDVRVSAEEPGTRIGK